MPVGTRRSSRLNPGETQPTRLDYIENQSSPRKRVSRAAKKISEEKIADTPEEILRDEKTDPASPKNSRDDELIKAEQGSVVGQPKDATSPISESVTFENSNSQDSEHSIAQEVTKSNSVEETCTKEVVLSKGKPVGETVSHCDVIKGVMEVYKQESTLQKRSKGMPKSGRPWKTEQTARFSNLRKDKPLKSSWQLKMAQKAEKLSVRKYQQELEESKRQAILLKKQRREEHQKRKEENQKKSEVVQIIKNPSKLKRMKKKQLRMIEKRP